jgi:hypothetical protein
MTVNSKLFVGISIVLAAALAIFVYRQSNVSPEPLETSAALEEDESALEKQESLPPTQAVPSMNTQQLHATPEIKAQLFAEYSCQKAACNLSPFLAENENEALWLRARGYPSPQQRKEAERLPTIELKLRAEKGDQTAVSLYGERLMEEKNWKEAYSALLPASRRGNIYAMYALSKYSAEHPQHKSPLEARTWLRLAYLAGDYKSTMQLVQTYPEFNGTAEQLLIDRDAAHYYRQFLNYRTYPRPPPSE